jgi:hypothetical protein
MRNQEWDPAAAELHALDLAQLIFRLFTLDAVHCEATLGVVDESEVLACLLNRNHVHEASRVGDVGAHFAIDLDEALFEDCLGLAVVERILETISHEDDQRHALANLVRTRRRARRIDAREFVEEPMARRRKAFLVLLSIPQVLSAVGEELRIGVVGRREQGVQRFNLRSSTHLGSIDAERGGVEMYWSKLKSSSVKAAGNFCVGWRPNPTSSFQKQLVTCLNRTATEHRHISQSLYCSASKVGC